eukprot:350413-Chlamydomonas_euryale.AAC.9
MAAAAERVRRQDAERGAQAAAEQQVRVRRVEGGEAAGERGAQAAAERQVEPTPHSVVCAAFRSKPARLQKGGLQWIGAQGLSRAVSGGKDSRPQSSRVRWEGLGASVEQGQVGRTCDRKGNEVSGNVRTQGLQADALPTAPVAPYACTVPSPTKHTPHTPPNPHHYLNPNLTNT